MWVKEDNYICHHSNFIYYSWSCSKNVCAYVACTLQNVTFLIAKLKLPCYLAGMHGSHWMKCSESQWYLGPIISSAAYPSGFLEMLSSVIVLSRTSRPEKDKSVFFFLKAQFSSKMAKKESSDHVRIVR